MTGSFGQAKSEKTPRSSANSDHLGNCQFEEVYRRGSRDHVNIRPSYGIYIYIYIYILSIWYIIFCRYIQIYIYIYVQLRVYGIWYRAYYMA